MNAGVDKKGTHQENVWIINTNQQRQRGLTITAVDINGNVHWTCKYKQSEVVVVMMQNNKK